MERLSILALALAVGCSCPRQQAGVDRDPPPAERPLPVPVERLRGTAFSAEGQVYLTLCGAERPSKLLGPGLDELAEALASLEQEEGGEPVPVEVIGAVRDQPGAGTMVQVSALNLALMPGGPGLCGFDGSYRYRAAGNEPFWSVTVLDGSLRFDAPDLEEPLELVATAFRVPGQSGPGWKGEEGGRSLQLQLIPGRCWDDMSGAAYPYRAVATLDGRSLEGCGEQGWETVETGLAGEGAAR
jgi:uncharacterized membrane protein